MPVTRDWPRLLSILAPKATVAAKEAFGFVGSAFSVAKIDSPLRQCHYVALSLEETGGFTRLEENLKYSAKGLMATFPKHFPTLELAQKFAFNAEAIANRVYGGRMGNVQPGDGWLFRGRGPFQLTGREAYTAVGRLAQLPLSTQPELALAPRYMFLVASQYWNLRGLSPLADKDDLRAFTKAVNGGYINFDARVVWFNKTKAVLNGEVSGG